MFYSYAPLIALGVIGATYAVKIPIEVGDIITGPSYMLADLRCPIGKDYREHPIDCCGLRDL
jgi:hypothetical protein